ncbi:hypothetical protein AQJ91_46765 [Streptomyces dysideae]|uniref:Uncharacterized protein n=1 Tax=Streptomyces dysideae TaxID=909626 RepID=A0A124IDA0_9ACTN|nr:hypothetical protein AQJ91_46765 [Streptomyces dysideae]
MLDQRLRERGRDLTARRADLAEVGGGDVALEVVAGQYSTDGISGSMSFKRRYTSGSSDSFALVTVTGAAACTGIPNGTYTDAVTGDVKTVTDGRLSVSAPGKGNLRVYVLNGPGKIGTDGPYLK